MKSAQIFPLLSLLPPALGDFLGPGWAPPRDLTSNTSLVASAFANLTTTLQGYIALNGSSDDPTPELIAGISELTFSIGVFSLHDSDAAERLQIHYTGPEIANAPNGTHAVDADSIYRVASVTKALTALTGLVELNETDWDLSLADVFPDLTAYVKEHPSSGDPINTVAWQDVTLRALAAQIGDIARDGFPNINDFQVLDLLGQADPLAMGLPPVTASDALENPPCLTYFQSTGDVNCPVTPFIETDEDRPPIFAPWSSPAYSDNGYSLLGLAMAAVTGRSYETMVQESVFGPLGMNSSGVTTPPADQWDRSVIAGSDPSTYFNISAGVLVSSGSALSTQRDIARLGVGILNATLLTPAATRRWLKPVSHTARLQYSVGAPWEIYRYTLPGSEKIVDIYTKSGDAGAYSAFFVLLPDYDLGFSLLSASSTLKLRLDMLSAIADVVTSTLVPAFEAQAAAESARRFAGVYANPALNASLTLVVNQTAASPAGPGLVIADWVSNGTDVLASPLANYFGLLPWRLVPTISDDAHCRAGFRLVSDNDRPSSQPPVGPGLFSGPGYIVADWIYADAAVYGGIGAALFEFDMGSDGNATAVSPAAFRMTLEKVE